MPRVGGLLNWSIVNPRKLEHRSRTIHAGIPILYFKGMRLMMFQLSGFYCRVLGDIFVITRNTLIVSYHTVPVQE